LFDNFLADISIESHWRISRHCWQWYPVKRM